MDRNESMCRCQLVCNVMSSGCRFNEEESIEGCIWLSGNFCTNKRAIHKALLEKLESLYEGVHSCDELEMPVRFGS